MSAVTTNQPLGTPTWIDLGIPFCGDYEEANLWNDADRARWKGCCEKRRAGRTDAEPAN